MNSFSVYILYSAKLNRFYIGTTDDFPKRLNQHNLATFGNSFTTKGIPWGEYLVIYDLTSKQAYSIEQHIKGMKSSSYIQNLKQYPEMIIKLVDRFKAS